MNRQLGTCAASRSGVAGAIEEVAMGTILRSYGGYIAAAIVALLFIFPAALPQDIKFLLAIICAPAAIIFVLVKVSGSEPGT
jgi:hypothetical protein